METCTDYVMLVDDSEIDLFINRKILEYNHFCRDIISTTSPREALDMLRNLDHKRAPEIIFLDLNMPVINGFKFLNEFSKLPKNVRDQISIVVLTSSDNYEDKKRVAKSSSVIKFISKPLTDEKVLGLRKMIVRAT